MSVIPPALFLDTAFSLAKFLNVSVACIRKHTRLTDMPVVRIGHAVRYDRQAVLAWLQQRDGGQR
jgi:hypothetical protein